MRVVSAWGGRRAWLGIAIALAGCGSPAAPPPAPQAAAEPFRVLMVSARGELDVAPEELTVVFTRAMHPLEAPSVDAQGVGRVERATDHAPVAGSWVWFGSRTAVFRPTSGAFAGATPFVLTIPAGTAALDGARLSAAETVAFSTPRPKLARASYELDDAAPVPPKPRVDIEFSLPVTAREVEARAHLQGKRDGKPFDVPLRVQPSSDGASVTWSSVPMPEIVSVQDLAVYVDKGLASPEGPLVSQYDTRLEAGAPGPVQVSIDCTQVDGACDPDDGARVHLSKWAKTLDLLAHVEPRFKVKPPGPAPDDTTMDLELGDYLKVQPRSSVSLKVRAGLALNDGDVLGDDRSFVVKFGPRAPRLFWSRLDERAVVEAARPALSFGVGSVNVARFEAAVAPLTERDLVAFPFAKRPDYASLRARPGAVTLDVTPRGKPDEDLDSQVDVPLAMRPKGAFGLLAVGLRAAPDLGGDVHLVSVTDLGLTTKWGPYGGLVWVTRLSTGEPVPGATITVTPLPDEGAAPGEPALRATTDADGLARLPRDVAERTGGAGALVVARAPDGKDWSYRLLGAPRPLEPRALVFTERSLYRPGDTVYAKGYLREPGAQGGLTAPAGQAVEAELRIEGRPVRVEKAVLDAFGAISFAFKLPPSKVGYGTIGLRKAAPASVGSRGDGESWTYAGFQVADYRAVEFKVDVATDRATYTRGDTAKVAITANYLFGAPMRGVPARTTYTRTPIRFAPPGLEAFTFGDSLSRGGARTDEAAPQVVTIGEGGRAVREVVLDLPEQRSAETVDFEADVDDVGGTFAVAGRAEGVVVQPGDLALGVRVPREADVFAGDRVPVETVAAAPQDGARARVAVHVALDKLGDGPPERLGECDGTTGEPLPRTCPFLTKDPGRYAITATAKDTRGRPLYASTDVFLMRKSNVSRPIVRPAPPVRALTFAERCERPQGSPAWVLSETSRYAPGDVGRICFGAPGARALFTTEREGILGTELWDLTGKGRAAPPRRKPYPFSIEPSFEPDVRLTVHSVSGRVGPLTAREDGSRRPMAYGGETTLEVTRPDKRLKVTIAPRPSPSAPIPAQAGPPRYRPGEAVDVDIAVVDGRGRPAPSQVTFYAVDQGVNLLSPYRLPDPEPFWEPRWSPLWTSDSRDALYWEPLHGRGHVTRSPSLRQGATSVEHDFRGAGQKAIVPVAVFRPDLLTGGDGRATVHVTLPHNTTTWELFAVAANDGDGFGVGTGKLVATQALIARPALPRFLRAGDRAVATGVIDSQSASAVDVEATLAASGAATGGGRVALQVPAEGHAPVAFELVAGRPGTSTVDFSVAPATAQSARSAEDLLDGVEVALPVRDAWPIETSALSGETRGQASEPIVLAGRRLDAGGLEYRVAATPMVALGEGFDQLLEYPYGCTEQLVSRLVPLVAARGLAARYGLPLPPDADARAREAVSALLTHRRADGGFSAWEIGRSSPWLTSYAAWGLSVAAEAGLDVPEGAIAQALRYVDGQSGSASTEDVAFAEDVRAARGEPRAAAWKELAALPALSVEARALLAHAAARTDPAFARALLGAIPLRASGATATVQPGEGDGTFPSTPARATALVLRAFAAVDPKNPLVPSLTRGLLALRKGGRWPTTQDAAWALLALNDLAPDAPAAPLAFRVRLGGRVVDEATLPPTLVAHAGSLTLPDVAKGATLTFESTSGAPLFYEAYLRTAPVAAPSTALDHGLQIDRSYRVFGPDGKARAGAPRVGDSVTIDVYVSSAAARTQVAVADPLPACLEPITGAFATEARGREIRESFYDHREFRDDRVLTFVDALGKETRHFEYRARVTTAGDFLAPPATAECMYAPDVFGRTEATRMTVAPQSDAAPPPPALGRR